MQWKRTKKASRRTGILKHTAREKERTHELGTKRVKGGGKGDSLLVPKGQSGVVILADEGVAEREIRVSRAKG